MTPATPIATTSPEAAFDDGPRTVEIPRETLAECALAWRQQLERAGLCEARRA